MILALLKPINGFAFLGDGGAGWAQYPYIVKMLTEAYKRYSQLKLIIEQGKYHDNYLKFINEGLDNVVGLISVLPIKDEKILSDIGSFQQAMKKVGSVYGEIPKSPESEMQLLHDQTIAESFELTNNANKYAERQEKNAVLIFNQAGNTSPKGAARINAATSAQVLHTMSQLLKINGQMLKLQSEQFAAINKQDKESVGHYQKISHDIQGSFTGYVPDFGIQRF